MILRNLHFSNDVLLLRQILQNWNLACRGETPAGSILLGFDATMKNKWKRANMMDLFISFVYPSLMFQKTKNIIARCVRSVLCVADYGLWIMMGPWACAMVPWAHAAGLWAPEPVGIGRGRLDWACSPGDAPPDTHSIFSSGARYSQVKNHMNS